eukprot:16448753-Heterocapsa_arctica.AAC.1
MPVAAIKTFEEVWYEEMRLRQEENPRISAALDTDGEVLVDSPRLQLVDVDSFFQTCLIT